jgi:hypothetical protein
MITRIHDIAELPCYVVLKKTWFLSKVPVSCNAVRVGTVAFIRNTHPVPLSLPVPERQVNEAVGDLTILRDSLTIPPNGTSTRHHRYDDTRPTSLSEPETTSPEICVQETAASNEQQILLLGTQEHKQIKELLGKENKGSVALSLQHSTSLTGSQPNQQHQWKELPSKESDLGAAMLERSGSLLGSHEQQQPKELPSKENDELVAARLEHSGSMLGSQQQQPLTSMESDGVVAAILETSGTDQVRHRTERSSVRDESDKWQEALMQGTSRQGKILVRLSQIVRETVTVGENTTSSRAQRASYSRSSCLEQGASLSSSWEVILRLGRSRPNARNKSDNDDGLIISMKEDLCDDDRSLNNPPRAFPLDASVDEMQEVWAHAANYDKPSYGGKVERYSFPAIVIRPPPIPEQVSYSEQRRTHSNSCSERPGSESTLPTMSASFVLVVIITMCCICRLLCPRYRFIPDAYMNESRDDTLYESAQNLEVNHTTLGSRCTVADLGPDGEVAQCEDLATASDGPREADTDKKSMSGFPRDHVDEPTTGVPSVADPSKEYNDRLINNQVDETTTVVPAVAGPGTDYNGRLLNTVLVRLAMSDDDFYPVESIDEAESDLFIRLVQEQKPLCPIETMTILSSNICEPVKAIKEVEPDLFIRVVQEWKPLLPIEAKTTLSKSRCNQLILNLARMSELEGAYAEQLLQHVEKWVLSSLEDNTCRSRAMVEAKFGNLSSMIYDLFEFLQVKYELPVDAVITLLPFLIANASVEDICCETAISRLVFEAEFCKAFFNSWHGPRETAGDGFESDAEPFQISHLAANTFESLNSWPQCETSNDEGMTRHKGTALEGKQHEKLPIRASSSHQSPQSKNSFLYRERYVRAVSTLKQRVHEATSRPADETTENMNTGPECDTRNTKKTTMKHIDAALDGKQYDKMPIHGSSSHRSPQSKNSFLYRERYLQAVAALKLRVHEATG